MPLRFTALPEPEVRRLRAGAPDANGLPPERRVSDRDGLPCRFCLEGIPAGRAMLLLAWRPFPRPQPYAETGPVFLCAECARRDDGPDLPPIVASRPRFLLRGYRPDDRIAEGTGGLVETAALAARAEALLSRDDVAYLHLRSATNGCYQLRIDRA